MAALVIRAAPGDGIKVGWIALMAAPGRAGVRRRVPVVDDGVGERLEVGQVAGVVVVGRQVDAVDGSEPDEAAQLDEDGGGETPGVDEHARLGVDRLGDVGQLPGVVQLAHRDRGLAERHDPDVGARVFRPEEIDQLVGAGVVVSAPGGGSTAGHCGLRAGASHPHSPLCP